MTYIKAIISTTLVAFALMPAVVSAQSNRAASSATAVTRTQGKKTQPQRRDVAPAKSQEQQAQTDAPDPDIEWMRVVYRHLDLDNDKNATLYYPETPTGGQRNLFSIIMRLVTDGEISAYEYLDGREVFTPEFIADNSEMLARFDIPFSEKKSADGRVTGITLDETDVPSADVLSYYILERWQFNKMKSRTSTEVVAICPILHKTGDIGEELRYPMFWVRMDDLRPYLQDTSVFVDDNDNTPRYSYADYFALNLYEGEIYKTRNVRNKSMVQLYRDEEARRHAADSIQKRLEDFDKSIWSPTREEIVEARKAKEDAKASIGSERKEKTTSSRRPTRSRGSSESSQTSGSAVRSVRDRK